MRMRRISLVVLMTCISLLLCTCPYAEDAAGANTDAASPADGTQEAAAEPEDPEITMIKAVQAALNAAGYNAGPVDGIFGGGTQGAVRSFRRDRHMGGEYNAVIDEALLYALGITHDLVWDPFHSIYDMKTVVDAGKGFGQELVDGMSRIGASWDREINLGNYLQISSGVFDVGIRLQTSDEQEELLATFHYDGSWQLSSIRNFETGDFYLYSGEDPAVSVKSYGSQVLSARTDTLAETQPAETQPAEAQPVETQTVEIQTVEIQPVETQPAAEGNADS